jgi:hypothetical protein
MPNSMRIVVVFPAPFNPRKRDFAFVHPQRQAVDGGHFAVAFTRSNVSMASSF